LWPRWQGVDERWLAKLDRTIMSGQRNRGADMRPGLLILAVVALAVTEATGFGQEATSVTFLEPDESAPSEELPAYRVVVDPERIDLYSAWLENESARWALDLYEGALQLARERGLPGGELVTYYVALVPGGNYGEVGFRLRDGDGWTEHAHTPYVILGPQEWRFATTFLHETGHVVLALLTGGEKIPKRQIASIPHTTAALTDRGTAFDEGYAIHLETVMAHLTSERWLHNRYRHGQFLFGEQPGFLAEYFRGSADLLTFSQTVARYYEVRENNYAFESAYKGPDYLRVQMEKARDFSELHNANQLLQSEGFYASFFFGWLMRGRGTPPADTVRARQARALTAIAEMLAAGPLETDAPHLIDFLETYQWLYPEEAAELADVFLDLTRGVFIDPGAAALWRDHYMAALRLDLEGLRRDEIAAARARWREELTNDPTAVHSRIGPQLGCRVDEITVHLVALGEPAPLSFDLNTAQPGVMRLIPEIDEAGVQSWLDARTQAPFTSVADFQTRVEIPESAAERMDCSQPAPSGL
jgi:hypothetical protein